MDEEVVWPVTRFAIVRKYIKARKLAGEKPILRVLLCVRYRHPHRYNIP